MRTYAQWLRCGGLEFYSSRFHVYPSRPTDVRLDLDAALLASVASKHTRTAVKFMQQKLELDPPYVAMLSLFDVRGGRIRTEGWDRVLLEARGFPVEVRPEARNRFDVDAFTLPEIIIKDAEEDVKEALMPVFDMIWQAAGFEECFLRYAKDTW